jgi:antitoxin CcdA
MPSTSRKAESLPVDSALLAQARELKIDASQAAENGLAAAIRREKERLWRIENAEAIKAANEYVEKHGLPLAKYRQF